MQALAEEQGFQIRAPRRLRYDRWAASFMYQVESSLDVTPKYAGTTVWISGTDGRRLAYRLPTGVDAGSTFTTWTQQFHFATMFGTAHQLLVALVGLLTAGLSLSGVWIWWRKRRRLKPSPHL